MGRPKSENKLVPVMVRLSAAEIEVIDGRRGDKSRSDYIRSTLMPPLVAAVSKMRQTPAHAVDCRCLSCAPPKEAAK